MFSLSGVLQKVLEAAGLLPGRAETIAGEVAAEYPDLRKAAEETKRRIREELNPSLNEATLEGLLRGAWDELKTGHPGFNPHHFGGA